MREAVEAISPLSRVLAAYAGRENVRHQMIWALDARLADIVRTTREPLIGQMRLTWWHGVLTDETGTKGRGDPLVDAIRQEGMGGARAKGLLSLIDGWEMLLDPDAPDDDALRRFGSERGGGMFTALAGDAADPPGWLEAAGAVWALWDLSGHVTDERTAARAVTLAREGLPAAAGVRWPGRWKPQQIAFGLARHDVSAGRRSPATLTPRLYARLLRIALLGG